MPDGITLTTTPVSVASITLNSQDGNNGDYYWSGTGDPRARYLALTPNPAQRPFILPLQQVTRVTAVASPFQSSPILVLFSSAQSPNLGNSTLVWVPPGCQYSTTYAAPNYTLNPAGSFATPLPVSYPLQRDQIYLAWFTIKQPTNDIRYRDFVNNAVEFGSGQAFLTIEGY